MAVTARAGSSYRLKEIRRMTKQAEIQGVILNDRVRRPLIDLLWKELGDKTGAYCEILARKVLELEHSQGVVIKVDSELPKALYSAYTVEGFTEEAVKNDMINAKYTAFEPLVEK